jgi:hypothetical protein
MRLEVLETPEALAERGVAGLTGGGLGSLPARGARVDPHLVATQTQAARDPATMIRPGTGILMPAVMDMQGAHATPRQGLGGQMQEQRGIGPAAERDHDAAALRRLLGQDGLEPFGGVR